MAANDLAGKIGSYGRLKTYAEVCMQRIVVATLGALFLSAAVVLADGANAGPQFSATSDVTKPVVRLTYIGVQVPVRIEYTLYGGGRLEKVITDGAYAKRQEVHLSDQQTQELLASLVAKGLADTDQDELGAKMARGWANDPRRPKWSPPIPATAPDAPTAMFELWLDSYASTGRPVTTRLQVNDLHGVARQLEGVAEIQGWVQLSAALEALVGAAEEKK